MNDLPLDNLRMHDHYEYDNIYWRELLLCVRHKHYFCVLTYVLNEEVCSPNSDVKFNIVSHKLE